MGTKETSRDDGNVLNFDCGRDYVCEYVCWTYYSVCLKCILLCRNYASLKLI